MQLIKISRNVAWAICLGTALVFAGCTGNNKATGADTAKTDSSVKKADTLKKDTTKIVPADSAGTPPSHVPKKDTTGKPRPIVRKT